LPHNNLLCYSSNISSNGDYGSNSSSNSWGGLGLVVVVRLMDMMVWQGRVVCFVRNVRGNNDFGLKGCCVTVAIVVFVSILLVVFSSFMSGCGGGLV